MAYCSIPYCIVTIQPSSIFFQQIIIYKIEITLQFLVTWKELVDTNFQEEVVEGLYYV